MLPTLIFPQFDPVLVHIGPFSIHWYALAYITGIVLGILLLTKIVTLKPAASTSLQAEEFLTWITIGILVGGRLGYVLFYQPHFFFTHPLEIPAVWHGGMSFHGGTLGVITAMYLFTRRHHLRFTLFSDRVTTTVPIGLGLGRLANFINGELWGRVASPALPWGMIFPDGGSLPRHPSQLYEALLEGAVLFTILYLCARKENIRSRPGCLTGLFLCGYALMRSFCECFREPDNFIGYLPGGLTMGQLLCLPMFLAGLIFIRYGNRHKIIEKSDEALPNKKSPSK